VSLNARMKFEKVSSKYDEHTDQELIHILSVGVRNKMHCLSKCPELMRALSKCNSSYGYAQHKRKNSNFEKVPSQHAQHARQKLKPKLSMRFRN
jgi:hypothetical protein